MPRRSFPRFVNICSAERPPLEAQIIDLVDEIAYNTADLDDAFEAHVLDFDQLRAEVPVFAAAYDGVDRRHPEGLRKLKFNEALKRILDRLATDLIENTRRQVEASGVETVEDVRRAGEETRGFTSDVAGECASLKRFLMSRVYSDPAIVEDRERSVAALDALFSFFHGSSGADAQTLRRSGQQRAAPSNRLRLYRRDDGPFPTAPVPRISGRA